ncbi:MAG TPA: hypothetical protein VFW45_04975 [Candidatus Polarisedimenticolia bacterium]|nr:hypothetical protein [Candidatus Polarisedimenticolia bacterium]
MKEQIRSGGEAMFEPHPEPVILHRYALGEGGVEAPGIGRHLETCATCQLEVETWRRIGRKKLAEPARSRPSLPWMSLAAGVGALFGLLVGWRLLSAPLRTEVPVPPAAPPVVSESARILVAPLIHNLPGLMRSGEVAVQHWSIDREEPYLNITVPLTIPEDASGSEPLRFEILGPKGEDVWHFEMPVSRVREHVESAGVVSLAVSPQIEPGKYQFRAVRTAIAGAVPLYQASVEIDYRQSPAATKAPQ